MAVVITPNMALSQQLRTGGGRNKPIIGWDNAVSTGTLTASSEAEGYPVTNLTNPSTSSEWRASGNGTQSITVTLGAEREINYIGIARHNFGSSGAAVSVTAEPGGVDLVPSIMPVSDAPLMVRFDPITVTSVTITISGGSVPARMSVLYAGYLTTVKGGMYQEVVPIPYGYQTDIVTNRAESGDFLGRIMTDQRLQLAYEFAYVEYDWFKANMGPFIKSAMLQPFFFAWLPEMYPEDVAFGWLTADINPISENFEGTVVVRFNMEMGGLTV